MATTIRVEQSELWPFYSINDYDDYGREIEVDDQLLSDYKGAARTFWDLYHKMFGDRWDD